ncbi:MAG TPA: hypothetical protein ENH82_12780 [bacterium]|nr:hypothetical protein [bacterium]
MSDTSAQFIKMADCPEIQDRWEPKIGDLTDRGVVIGLFSHNYLETDRTKGISWEKGDFIYFPRQSKLQKMVRDNDKNKYPFDLLDNFHEWSKSLENGFSGYYLTMRQLWLGFVMWVLHKKKWTGAAWEASGEGGRDETETI